MAVFISSAGEQGRKVAGAFREWLPRMLPGIDVSADTRDEKPGEAGLPALLSQLEKASLCLLFLTPQNVRSPWMYFEAGAMAGKKHGPKIVPYLAGVSGSYLMAGPLSQFSWVDGSRQGTWSLLRALNREMPEPRDEAELEHDFSNTWGWVKRELDSALTEGHDPSDAPGLEVQPLLGVYQLTPQSKRLLVEASQDRHGVVLMVRTMGGLIVQANGKQLVEAAAPRVEAGWQAAVRLLLQVGLLEPRGAKGEVFALTAEGYRVADGLSERTPAPERADASSAGGAAVA
jgi:hypothetical protein